MPWANFDDKFPRHPKVRRLSDGAFRLHVAGICYCSEFRTDGQIDVVDVRDLVPRFRPAFLTELVERRMWIDLGTKYQIHDYLDWNRSRAQIEEAEENNRKRQKKWREEHRNEDGTFHA